ncbi:hypothetical protein [Halorubrum tebenquichense]|uniref:Uncharacterized protein n=1 Tax=Halorubrum tebenquichense DSM 14210 TaxID=1227485 RepID=M0DTL8_9EURY|nr:hypothetical protein [Halorubrum tebenquichense]ELZ37469.1 hypothetical protein C472_08434 [Halorubrum tebenquichense DSM 14210]
MVSTTAVKRALAALATRTDTARRPYAAVIEEADVARTDLRRAAGFVDSGGLDRLADAVDTAEGAGDADAAERGRAALDAYREFRRAATEAEGTGDGGVATDAGDHFRPGPGIPKPDTGQNADR